MPIASRFAPITSLPARLRGRSSPLRIALAVGLCAAAGLGHVHLRLQVIDAGYAISRETHARHELQDANQRLRLELQTRRDPAMVERRAHDELHMVPPDPAAIRTAFAPASSSQAAALEAAPAASQVASAAGRGP